MSGFVVICSVWGGTTGHRTSLLKENGTVRTFPTHEEAEEMVRELYENRKTRPLPPGVKTHYQVGEAP